MKTQRIALYARVSSKRQNQARTIETQIAALRDYSEKHAYVVDEELIFLDDGVSGATLERPGLDALRDRALKGDIDQMLVLCPDRLARKHAHQLIVVEEFQRLGVRIVFTNRPVSETPEDQLLLQIQGIMAEYEREKITERSRRGKVYKAKAGSVNVLGGAPYGYVYIRKTDIQEARYEIHPQQALIVRRIFHLYTSECKSIGAIARQLTEEKIPSRTGKEYWERSSIWGMLKNPAYMGKAAFRKTRHVQREKLTKPAREHGGYAKHALSSSRDRPKEDWIVIAVPAIIDEKTFHIAQERLQENKKRSPRNNKTHHYLLSGLLSCTRCGYSVYGNPASHSRYKRCYYRCMGQDGYRWPTGRVCDGHPVRVEVVDELVWDNVQKLIENPQLVLQEYTQRSGKKKKQRLSLEHLITKKQQENRQQELQKQRLLDLYQTGSIGLEDIQSRLEKIRQRIEKIQQEWKLLHQEQEQQLQQLQLIEQFESFKDRLHENLGHLTFEQKKALVRLLVKEVIVDTHAEEIIICHTLPLDNLNSSDHSGSPGSSDGKTPREDRNYTGLESSENIESKREFKEIGQKSFLLCTGSTHRPLRRSELVRREVPSIIHHSGFQPLPQYANDARVIAAAFHHLHQQGLPNRVTIPGNIRINHTILALERDTSTTLINRIVRTPPGAKPIGALEKVRLKHGLQHQLGRRLGNPIFHHRNSQRSFVRRARFRYPVSYYRLRGIGLGAYFPLQFLQEGHNPNDLLNIVNGLSV